MTLSHLLAVVLLSLVKLTLSAAATTSTTTAIEAVGDIITHEAVGGLR